MRALPGSAHFSNEESFLHALQERDEYAMRLLYQDLAPDLYFYARKLISNKDEAKDYVQEAFIAFWKSSQTYTDIEHVRKNIYTIVYHKCLNAIRNNQRQELHHEIIAEEQASFTDPYLNDLFLDHLKLIWRETEALPEKQKQIIMAMIKEDQSVREVALALNITPEHVRSYFSRALKFLRNNTNIDKLLIICCFFKITLEKGDIFLK